MCFSQAKKLHSGDEIVVKETNTPAIVLETRIAGKIVWVLCNYQGCKEFQHTEIK